MINRNLNFSSLNIGYLKQENYMLSNNQDTYSYFKAEYYHAQPYDFERTLIPTMTVSKTRIFFDKIKSILSRDKSMKVSPNSSAYTYLVEEYKGNPFLQDLEHNILIPIEESKSIKARKLKH